MFVSVYSLCKSQTIRSAPVKVYEVVSERNLSLLFCGEIDNDHYDSLIKLIKNRGYVFLTKFVFMDNLFQKHLP
jgi:hypothetical protein